MFGGDSNKRWFEVKYTEEAGEDGELALCYFKNQSTKEPRGWVFLRDVTRVYKDSNDDGSPVMVVVHPSRTMRLFASSTQQTELWIKRIQDLVDSVRPSAEAKAKASGPSRAQAKHEPSAEVEAAAAQFKDDAPRSPARGQSRGEGNGANAERRRGREPAEDEDGDAFRSNGERAQRFQNSRDKLSRSYEEGLGASLGPAYGATYDDRDDRDLGGNRHRRHTPPEDVGYDFDDSDRREGRYGGSWQPPTRRGTPPPREDNEQAEAEEQEEENLGGRRAGVNNNKNQRRSLNQAREAPSQGSSATDRLHDHIRGTSPDADADAAPLSSSSSSGPPMTRDVREDPSSSGRKRSTAKRATSSRREQEPEEDEADELRRQTPAAEVLEEGQRAALSRPTGGARRTGFSEGPEPTSEDKTSGANADPSQFQQAGANQTSEAQAGESDAAAAAKTPPRRRPKRLADEDEDEEMPGRSEAKDEASPLPGAKGSAESDSDGEDVDDILASSKKRIAEREALSAKESAEGALADDGASGNEPGSAAEPMRSAPSSGIVADHDYEDADWDADAKVREVPLSGRAVFSFSSSRITSRNPHFNISPHTPIVGGHSASTPPAGES